MLRPELRVAVHHHPRLPATQLLQLVAARASLPMPRSPGVPQVVKAKVGQLRALHRFEPRRVADSPANRLSAKREAEARVLPLLAFQDGDRVIVQRAASRRSILGVVQPGRPAFQIVLRRRGAV